jgi:VWFA-related protein
MPGCTRILVVSLLAGVALAGAAQGQTPQPSFQANTRLVEVDVIVRSKERSVTGLKKEEFSISDNGKRQTIATFRVVEPDRRPSRSEIPEGVSSNRLSSRDDEAAGVTVLLMDRLNTAVGDQTEVRRQLLHYLETAPPGERFALYSLNKTLRVIQDFTDDPERLRKMVFSRASAESSVDLTADLFAEDLPVTGDAMTDAMIQNAANEMKDFAMQNRVNITAYSLQLIAKHLAGLPGRKKLVWFTSSFPAQYSYEGSRNGRTQIEIRGFGDDIDKAARALNDANVAVYPVDPRNPIDGGFGAPGIDTMNLFAGKTGGRAFYVINDLESAIRTIREDSDVTYSLGYYPDEKLDGSYHTISVKVAGHGFDVRHRKGYFVSEAKLPTDQQRKITLNDAFLNPLESTAVGLMAKATPVAGKPGVYNLDLRLNLNELHLEREREREGEQNKERWVALVSIATEFSARKKPNGTLEEVKITLTGDRLREALRTGYMVRRPFEANQLTGELRVVVQDRVTGDAGSVSLRIGK